MQVAVQVAVQEHPHGVGGEVSAKTPTILPGFHKGPLDTGQRWGTKVPFCAYDLHMP